MLVNHADPVADRIVGVIDLYLLPAHKDLTRVGSVEPIEDVHEGRFAGAVLSQQRQDLPLIEGQVDAIVREDTGECLCNTSNLQDRVHGVLLCRTLRQPPASQRASSV